MYDYDWQDIWTIMIMSAFSNNLDGWSTHWESLWMTDIHKSLGPRHAISKMDQARLKGNKPENGIQKVKVRVL